ncbi:aa3-type cytochrome c oxidase subunit IV [Paracoccus sp. (in: a-proteobacteria)]
MASEHKHGSMDITAHQKTFAGFVKAATIVSVASILVLIFMALTNS